MSVILFSLQNVIEVKGQEVAVYVCRHNYPEDQLLSDASDVVEEYSTRADKLKDTWFYSQWSGNAERLSWYCRLLRRAKKVIATHSEVAHAIFVYEKDKSKWRGKHTLYANRNMDEFKADTPEYTGCNPIGEIVV